jgi:hypothetical protein
LGFTLTKDELDLVYTEFISIADKKKGLMDEEILALLNRVRAGAVVA